MSHGFILAAMPENILHASVNEFKHYRFSLLELASASRAKELVGPYCAFYKFIHTSKNAEI